MPLNGKLIQLHTKLQGTSTGVFKLIYQPGIHDMYKLHVIKLKSRQNIPNQTNCWANTLKSRQEWKNTMNEGNITITKTQQAHLYGSEIICTTLQYVKGIILFYKQ